MGGKGSKPIVVATESVEELEVLIRDAEALYAKKLNKKKLSKGDPAAPPNPFLRAVTADGENILVAAIKRKDVAFVTMLLDHGAPLELTDRYTNMGVLGVAADCGSPDVVRLLIKRGAPWIADKTKRTPLHIALLAGSESDKAKNEVVREILQGCCGTTTLVLSPQSAPATGSTPTPQLPPAPTPSTALPPAPSGPPPTPTPEAVAAAEAQQKQQESSSTQATPPTEATSTSPEPVKPQKPPALRLMERTEDGSTPLHIALRLGNVGWAREILKVREGALNIFTADAVTGNTPLLQAIETCPEAVPYFVAMGAPVNVTNKIGNTPLHLAAAKGNFELVSRLLSAQAHVSARNTAGNSVLHEIVRAKAPLPLIKVILDSAPENASMRNLAGQTALDVAKELKFDEAVPILEPATHPLQEGDKVFKIQFISDIHLEFGNKPEIVPSAPFLALLGDTGLLSKEGNCLKTTTDFLNEISEKFERVFIIMGNHEHYKSDYDEARAAMQDVCSKNTKLCLMTNNSEVHDGVRIVGTTLWTEVPERYAPEIKKCLSDYRAIRFEDGELTTDHTTKWHRESVEFIQAEIAKAREANEKVVVLCHHGPLLGLGCGSPDTHAQAVKFAFGTDLKHLMGPPVVGWLYGHTHWWQDMTFNGTRVMNNPHGYPKEQIDYLKNCVFTCPI